MKKGIVLFVLFLVSGLFASEVDISELSKNIKKVHFINYHGPVRKADLPAALLSIGKQLARGVGTRRHYRYRYHLKYSIIHADNERETNKLAADICFIDPRAKVGNIKYLRLILRGYLEARYHYTVKEARVLAVFITYYNAVYRGNLDYLGGVYKKAVMRYLNKQNAGLSTLYADWPGKTAMLIPLTAQKQRQSINSLDTFLLSDTNVIEQMRKEPDKSVNERQDMVDLQKKQIQKKKEKIERQKKEIQQKKKEIQTKQKKLEQKKKEIERKKKQIQNITNPIEKKRAETKIKKEEKKVEKEQKTLNKQKNEVQKKEQQTKKEEKKTEKQQRQVKNEQQQITKDKEENAKKKGPEYLEKKAKELKNKEQALNEKEKELKKKERNLEDKHVMNGRFYYLKINKFLDNGIYENELFSINPATRKILKKSPYKMISGRKYDVFTNGVVVIGFLEQNLYNHRLVLLNKDTLKAMATSKDIIFYRSFVEIRNGFIFAIMTEKGKYYLGKYDTKMQRVAKSVEPVAKDSFITFYGDYIYINNALKNKILVLNKNDLTLTGTIDFGKME